MASQPLSREALIRQYCLQCHNTSVKSGNLTLEGLSPEDPALPPRHLGKGCPQAERWGDAAAEDAAAGGRSCAISPRDSFGTGLRLHRKPYAGSPLIRRLNRTEYTNTVRDLLAIELPLAAELPEDGVAAGFDNVADALSISPLLLERYLKVARKVSRTRGRRQRRIARH